MEFETKFASFLNQCQEMLNSYYQSKFKNLKAPTLQVEKGRRFYKILAVQDDHQRVFAFVDTKTESHGDILKPATFRAPAKHARGNIFDEHNGMSKMTAYGPEYLR